ncbi:hypothetical protein QHH11_16240 [Aphanizomenon sp. PH219]|nr:hypothetical protein [Aphanizomenon sp. 202]MDK2460668.1 hypothetical protein [Aphanizomenon sp. PH219]MDM3859136.1 hypothetical protein [Aphanizomenon gracile PMC644.10]
MKKLLIILVLGGLCVGCGYETPEEKELREYRFQEELNPMRIIRKGEVWAGATSREDMDRLFDYAKQNDNQAIKSMLLQGRAMVLKGGDKVFVVGCEGVLCAVTKIRLEGTTQELYVPTEAVSK